MEGKVSGTSNAMSNSEVAPPRSQFSQSANFNVTNNNNVNMDDLDKEMKTLKFRIVRDTLRLNEIRNLKLENTTPSNESAIRKKFMRAQDVILKHMLKSMEECNAQGFVYGIIEENGKAATGASENLRAWWKEKVQFDKNASAAIAEYNACHFPANPSEEKPDVNIRERLLEISDSTLGSLVSALMQYCKPPQRKNRFENGIPSPWWPTTKEAWWSELGFPADIGTPPYKKPHYLRKIWKVAVLVAVIKNMSPDTKKMRALVQQSKGLQEKISAKESALWSLVLDQEDREYRRLHPDIGSNNDSSFSNNAGENTTEVIADGNPRFDLNENFTMIESEGVHGVDSASASHMQLFPQGQMHLNVTHSSEVFTCMNTVCPHNSYCNGFSTRAIRNMHQYECKYNASSSSGNQVIGRNTIDLLANHRGYDNHQNNDMNENSGHNTTMPSA